MFLFDNDIDDTSGHYDNLHNLLAIEIASCVLVFEGDLLHFLLRSISCHVDGEARLTVKGDGHCDGVLLEVALVKLGPGSVYHTLCVAEPLPEFLADVGGKRGREGLQAALTPCDCGTSAVPAPLWLP